MDKNKNFRIEVEQPNYNIKMDHNRSIITLGSCFANELNSLLIYYGFNSLSYHMEQFIIHYHLHIT